MELEASPIFQNKVIDKRLRSLRLWLYCLQHKAFIQGFPKHGGITDIIRVTHENNGISARKGGSSLLQRAQYTSVHTLSKGPAYWETMY